LLNVRIMKIIAAAALTWSALVGLYAVNPWAGIAALGAGFGYMARGVYLPVLVRVRQR
jgi:uncharacterized membrane protein